LNAKQITLHLFTYYTNSQYTTITHLIHNSSLLNPSSGTMEIKNSLLLLACATVCLDEKVQIYQLWDYWVLLKQLIIMTLIQQLFKIDVKSWMCIDTTVF